MTLFSLSAWTTYWIVVYAHQITSIETFSAKPARTTVVTTRGTTANYYVDVANGSDANAGTSDAPWKMITYARTIALAGDTINVRRGKYVSAERFPIVLVSGVVSTSGPLVTTILIVPIVRKVLPEKIVSQTIEAPRGLAESESLIQSPKNKRDKNPPKNTEISRCDRCDARHTKP